MRRVGSLMTVTVLLVLAAAATDAMAAQRTVTIKDIRYNPAQVQVKAGDTVVWVNRDDRDHTVTADDGSFNSGKIGPGKRFEFTFPDAGTFTYHCDFHPRMKGEVKVVGKR